MLLHGESVNLEGKNAQQMCRGTATSSGHRAPESQLSIMRLQTRIGGADANNIGQLTVPDRFFGAPKGGAALDELQMKLPEIS